ncbi:MAG: hypothetical protein WA840_00345, partial [Caulobacteraceae bacterium]
MRARKRLPEPLNFTPDEPSQRESARNRATAEATPAKTSPKGPRTKAAAAKPGLEPLPAEAAAVP